MGRLNAGFIRLGAVLAASILAAAFLASPCRADIPYAARSPYRLNAALTADSSLAWRLVREQKMDSAFAVVRGAVAQARRSGDRRALSRFLFIQGAAYCVLQNGQAALPPLDEAVALAEAEAETLALLPCLRQKCYALGLVGRLDDQEFWAHRLLATADAAGSLVQQAVAHNFLGWDAQHAGRFGDARHHLEEAVRIDRQLGNTQEELFCLVTLGGVELETGDYEEARAVFVRCLALAHEHALAWPETQALQALGVIEETIGDPARAVAYYGATYRAHLAHGQVLDAVIALQGFANAQIAIGRPDVAAKLVRDGLALTSQLGSTLLRGDLLAQLGAAEEAEQRPAAAAAVYRSLLALGDSVGLGPRVRAALGLARVLERADSVAAVRTLLSATAEKIGTHASLLDRLDLDLARARRLRIDGQAREAEALARHVAQDAGVHGLSARAIAGWHQTALASRALDRPDSAAAAFARATEVWSSWRQRPSDPEWREQRGSYARALASDYATFLLTSPRVPDPAERRARAYDLLERMKARTLLERMAGPRALAVDSTAQAPRASGLRELQEQTLAPGELLLEAFVGPDTSYLFAITRDSCRVVGLPGESVLRGASQLAHDLMARPAARPTDLAATDAAALALGSDLLSGVRDLLAHARTVLVAPDGSLYRTPFAALRPGGENDATLLERARVTFVPSATWLGRIRARERARGRGLLALIGAGPRLEGAQNEVRWLRSEYRDVTVRAVNEGPPPSAASLASYAVIHFAGHTELDDRFPWRSGLALRDTPAPPDTLGIESILAGESTGTDVLRADAIAAQPLGASLVVLSSCETAAGRIVSGEGIAGLTSAFLAAGAPTVVATLWPVEDQTTARLVREFYRGFARGLTAAEALQAAQLRIRRTPATAHPFYWAGFVLVGDGDTRLPFAPNPFSPGRLARYLVAGLAIAAVFSAAVAWRTRRP